MKIWELLAVGFVTMCMFALLGALLWPYTINTWLVYMGKEETMLWWHGALLGFVPTGLGQLAPIFATLTWIAMMFLG